MLNAVLTIVLVASFNFALFRILPGDPARLLLPKGKTDPSVIERQRKTFNLDKPLQVQFLYYWRDTIQGKFGMSFAEKRRSRRWSLSASGPPSCSWAWAPSSPPSSA